MTDTHIAAVVLAAGFSERMGTPKALVGIGEKTFVQQICDRLAEAAFSNLIVVTAPKIAPLLYQLLKGRKEKITINPSPQRGQLSSLLIGLDIVEKEAEAVLVALVDHPLVKKETYELLRKTARENPGKIILPRYQARRGHPVVFPRSVFPELRKTPLAQGAVAVVRKDPARIFECVVDDPGIVKDIDMPEDLTDLSQAPPAS